MSAGFSGSASHFARNGNSRREGLLSIHIRTDDYLPLPSPSHRRGQPAPPPTQQLINTPSRFGPIEAEETACLDRGASRRIGPIEDDLARSPTEQVVSAPLATEELGSASGLWSQRMTLGVVHGVDGYLLRFGLADHAERAQHRQCLWPTRARDRIRLGRSVSRVGSDTVCLRVHLGGPQASPSVASLSCSASGPDITLGPAHKLVPRPTQLCTQRLPLRWAKGDVGHRVSRRSRGTTCVLSLTRCVCYRPFTRCPTITHTSLA